MPPLWGTERLDFGTVSSPVNRTFAHDFSSAISLAVAASIKDYNPKGPGSLEWHLFDSIDGSPEWSIEDTDGRFQGNLGAGLRFSETRRFVVPFGPQLSIGLHPQKATPSATDDVTYEDVTIRLFWRGIG